MSFLRKKRVKFSVEMVVQKFTDVPLLNAVIFAKVRLLDCGSFVGVTLHRAVCSHVVDFISPSPSHDQTSNNIRLRVRTISGNIQHDNHNQHRHSTIGLIDDMALVSNIHTGQGQIERRHSLTEKSPREYLEKQQFEDILARKQQQEETEVFIDEHGNVIPIEKNPQPFQFHCFIPYEKYTGELEECRCKISLRKEDRAGRSPQKLGFVMLNLSEFAGTGSEGITQSFLLEGYSKNSQRQDNSRIHVNIRMQHNSADPLFKVPMSASLFRYQNGSYEEISQQQHGNLLNPADRKAPPPSPIPILNNGQQLMMTASTSSATNSSQIDSFYSTSSCQTGISGGSFTLPISSFSCANTFSTVPGGIGHNMSSRVQKTRRDPGDVIDEVLAENCATIARKQITSSSSSDEYESS